MQKSRGKKKYGWNGLMDKWMNGVMDWKNELMDWRNGQINEHKVAFIDG